MSVPLMSHMPLFVANTTIGAREDSRARFKYLLHTHTQREKKTRNHDTVLWSAWHSLSFFSLFRHLAASFALSLVSQLNLREEGKSGEWRPPTYVKHSMSSMWTSSTKSTPGTSSATPWSMYLKPHNVKQTKKANSSDFQFPDARGEREGGERKGEGFSHI